MTTKKRDFICFGDVDPSVPWDKLGYLAWHERAQRYLKAGYRSRKCKGCSRWYWHDETHDCKRPVDAAALPQHRCEEKR